jgi:hypothetical protein
MPVLCFIDSMHPYGGWRRMINNASFAGSILYWQASRQHQPLDRADLLFAALGAKDRRGI